MSLTSACCVHSNVYGLGSFHRVLYLIMVDPILSTSSAVQSYHRPTFGSIEIPLLSCCFISSHTGNSSPIGKEPVSWRSPSKIKSSYTEQAIIPFTNVLQGHTTVVLVCCTSEWEPHTCEVKGRGTSIITFMYFNLFRNYRCKLNVKLTVSTGLQIYKPNWTCTKHWSTTCEIHSVNRAIAMTWCHEINSHKINCHQINYHKINSWD